jgi:hypothetical protein
MAFCRFPLWKCVEKVRIDFIYITGHPDDGDNEDSEDER